MDTPTLTLHATISPTEDGQGFIGLCHEIDQMTCGETLAEMPELLSALVASFFAFEQHVGNLAACLAGLRGPDQPELSVPFIVRLCLNTDASLRLTTSALELRVA